MIVGKNEETKGFKVYIPKDMIVVTTQHIGNNVQLKEQLKREDPELWSSVEEQKKAAKPKLKPHKKRNKDRPSAGSDDGDHSGWVTQRSQGNHLSTKRMRTRHVVNAVTMTDPNNYREAMCDEHTSKWIEALQGEIEALEINNIRGSLWVYKTKTHADGTVKRRKGRLVAYGNEQVYGVDYTDTFSAVLVITTGKGVPARHGDVPSACVKADKEDHIEIFLHRPKRMVVRFELLALLGVKHKHERVACGTYCYTRLWLSSDTANAIRIIVCTEKRDAGGVTPVGIYVDDLLVTGTSNERVQTFFKEMVVLELKALGVVSKFLGIGFEYDKDKGWLLEQRQVI
ncbi:hypothetical protein PHMEG_0004492 [Phytophthora megakarya]|uniref:Reverse transcriptase Ty1/copia-type domain-containing protein n=1 Tax=Phytophthora megakarya TaxID=4795 RepID=A0A225WVC8_9STRA|nr:hypothetical protein PHMEG_0004492 [Phytophthora megakarya]